MSGAKRNSMRTIDRQGKAAVRRQCSQEKLRFSREKRDVCGSHGRIDFSFSRASSSVAGSSTHPHPGPLPRERETGTTCRESDVSMRRKKSRIPRGKQHIDPSFFYFLWHAHNKMQKLSGKTTHFENHFATPCISVGAMVQNIREIRAFYRRGLYHVGVTATESEPRPSGSGGGSPGNSRPIPWGDAGRIPAMPSPAVTWFDRLTTGRLDKLTEHCLPPTSAVC